MRISEYAKTRDVSSKTVMEELKKMGVEIKTATTTMPEEKIPQIDAILKTLKSAPEKEGHKETHVKAHEEEHKTKAVPHKHTTTTKHETVEAPKHPHTAKHAPVEAPTHPHTAKHAPVEAPIHTHTAKHAPVEVPVVKPEPVKISTPVPVIVPVPVAKIEPVTILTPAPVIAPIPVAPVIPEVAVIPEIKKEIIEINRNMTVGELAKHLEIKPNELIKKLMGMGVLASINQPLNDEATQIMAAEYNKEVKYKDVYGDDIFADEEKEDETQMTHKAPIVTIMGHVDHGKTSLLDAVRMSDVVSTEHGGITQKIGAYIVHTPKGEIVFLDTPGHAAFTAMRARGAQATDIVILIVAADDGVMPTTVEAIDHARAAGAPIIVAINKIDKDGAQPERVKQELTKYNLLPEEWGGKNQFVEISAKKKIGIDKLLETVLLEAEMMELKTNINRKAAGVIIEGKVDKGRGSVGTVLVQKGTLRVGDSFITNMTCGKVKALFDDHGKRIKEAKACMPVEVLGFEEVPTAGDKFKILENEREVRVISERRREDLKRIMEDKKRRKITLEDLKIKIDQGAEKKLLLIVKGDSNGSIEALGDAILRLSSETEINVQIIHKDVGDITESDVLLADASNAIIIGYFVSVLPAAKELAKTEGVEIKMYHIIYEVVDAIKAAMEGLLEPEYETVKIGEAEVRQTFKIVSDNVIIAGCYIKTGKAYHDSTVSIFRGGMEILKTNVKSLHRFKDTVKEVKEGYECGVVAENYPEPKEGDVILFFEERQKLRKI